MNTEVELKITLDSDQYKTLSKWLGKNAEFLGEESHEEYYLNSKKIPFTFINDEGFKDADDYLRIRKKGDKTILCLKKWHRDPDDHSNHTHCDEYEVEVDNAETLLNLLKELSFDDVTEVIKNREKYNYKDIEIVIDDVKKLGVFAEFELLDFDGDVKQGRERLKSLINEIGIKDLKFQRRGYVSMLWNPDIDFTH